MNAEQINDLLMRLESRAESLCDQLRRGEDDELTIRRDLRDVNRKIRQLQLKANHGDTHGGQPDREGG